MRLINFLEGRSLETSFHSSGVNSRLIKIKGSFPEAACHSSELMCWDSFSSDVEQYS